MIKNQGQDASTGLMAYGTRCFSTRAGQRSGLALKANPILYFLLLLSLFCGLAFPTAGTAWAKSSEQEEEGKNSVGSHFARVDPLQIPVLKNGKVVQILILSVTLEVNSDEDIKTVEAYAPLLRDGYLSSLYGALHIRGSEGDLVDIELVRKKIRQTNESILPPDLVKNILLQQLQQRRP